MHTLAYLPPADTGLNLVHADSSLLVVDKPAGLLTVPGRGDDKADCLSARVQSVYPDALVIHRLDMATSGLVVFGRGLDAQRRLGSAFEHRRVVKRYVAVVRGLVVDDAGEIDLPLAADWPSRPRQKVDFEAGKRALTRFTVLSREPLADCSRVALEPLTGRTHQLRVHLMAIGHPILGDTLYGAAERAPRLLLHAQSLVLPHPDDGRLIEFESPAPF